MSKERCRLIQKVLCQLVRTAVGVGKSSPISLICDSLSILPIHIGASTRRARLLYKSKTLNTYLGVILEIPFKARKKTWYTNARIWIHRFPKAEDLFNAYNPDPKGALKILRGDMVKKWRKEDKSKARKEYDHWEFGVTNLEILDLQEEFPELNWAVGILLKMRWRTIWWTNRFSRILGRGQGRGHGHGHGQGQVLTREIPQEIPNCIVCNGNEPEGVEHYLLRCPRWEKMRCDLITPILDTRGVGESMDRSYPIGMMLLGGRQGVRQVFTDGTAVKANVETHQGFERDWLVGVAKFIQMTWCIRRQIMTSLIPPRGEAQTGRPIANSEQSVTLRPDKQELVSHK
jgi:hypothetical protein